MKRSLVITGAVAVFAASTALSIVVADSLQDEPRTALPAAAADGGAAVLTDPLITDEEVVANDDLPSDAPDAGYLSLLPTSGGSAAEEPFEGAAYPFSVDGGTASGGGSAGGEGASGASPAEVGAAVLGGSPSTPERYASRFVDLCADNPGSTLCPTGIGGTVLVPFEGDVDFGTFDVFGIYSTPSPFWRCELPAALEANEYPVLVNATHPARIEIEYHPVGDPTDSHTVVVDLTDPEGEAYQQFSVYFGAHGVGPAEGVHHCFVLQAVPGQWSYEVTAAATSFTGDIDTMTSRVDFHPTRPAVIVTPQADDPLKAVIGVPVSVDPEEYAVVRMLRVSDGRSCADIEDDMLSGDSSAVVPAPGYGWHEARTSWSDTFVPAPPGWAADVYDLDAWYVQLEESTDYQLCVWWLQTPDRSFDPAYMSVTERESRLISTPDFMHTAIEVEGVHAGNDPLAAESVSIYVPNGCNPRAFTPAEFRVPTIPVDANYSQFFLDGPQLLCEYPGISQPATTRVVVTGPGMEPKTFALPTPLTTERSSEMYFLYFGPSTCLSGESFGVATGDCASRQADHPDVVVDVVNVQGASNGLTDWLITDGSEFDPPDRAPEALPVDIRLDVFSSRVETIDRDSLRVTANFDRPVALNASLEGDPCLVGAAPSFSSTTLSDSYTFVLDGLCTLTTYGVRLEANDGTTTTSFSPLADQWHGFGQTDGYHVSYTVEVANRRPVSWNERLLASWSVHFDVLTADGWGTPHTLRGEPVPVGAPSRCLEPRVSPAQTAVWGDTVEFRAQVRLLSATIVGRGYCSRIREAGYADMWQDVVSTIPIADLMAGPVTVTLPFSDDGEFAVDLIITASVEE